VLEALLAGVLGGRFLPLLSAFRSSLSAFRSFRVFGVFRGLFPVYLFDLCNLWFLSVRQEAICVRF
jgi:hypothetical protein